MKRKKIKIIIMLLQILVIIAMFSTNVFADATDAPKYDFHGYYGIYEKETNPFSDAVGQVIGIGQAIGMSVAVIMLTIIGIKYILTSPDGKAELKQQLFPYLIGCIILFGASWIIPLIANVARNNIK